LTGLCAQLEIFESSKPSAQARVLVVFFGELLEDGRYISNHVLEHQENQRKI
jgi:hypothetical protein